MNRLIFNFCPPLGILLIFWVFLSVLGCKKENSIKPFETGTAIDIEGNTYKTIKIGNQWWFAENLKTIRYRDSTLIPLLQGDTALWANDTSGAYARGSFGQWYNWYAVNNSKGLAPNGWHVATEKDWKELEKYAGMSDQEVELFSWRGEGIGDKLKIKGIDEWKIVKEVFATDDFGFAAQSGSCVLFDGRGGQPSGTGYTGFWWSSSSNNNETAFYRYLDYKKTGVFRFYGSKNYGFSVRCVKD